MVQQVSVVMGNKGGSANLINRSKWFSCKSYSIPLEIRLNSFP